MLSLGIESTAHTFGCSVVDSRGDVLSDARDVYKAPEGKRHTSTRSIRHHMEASPDILKNALKSANVTMKDIDIVRLYCWTWSWTMFARWCCDRKDSCRILQEATRACQPCPWSYRTWSNAHRHFGPACAPGVRRPYPDTYVHHTGAYLAKHLTSL